MLGPPLLLGALLATGAGPAPRSLSGSWLYGAGRPEPKEAVVVVARCWNADVAVRLVESAGKVTGTITWIPVAQGAVPTHRREESERLTGTRVGDRVTLTGEHRVVEVLAYPAMPANPTATSVRYALRVDRRTGHLVGTRDGQPFWLAPIKIRPTVCGPGPP
jgi:hypothetical protein